LRKTPSQEKKTPVYKLCAYVPVVKPRKRVTAGGWERPGVLIVREGEEGLKRGVLRQRRAAQNSLERVENISRVEKNSAGKVNFAGWYFQKGAGGKNDRGREVSMARKRKKTEGRRKR